MIGRTLSKPDAKTPAHWIGYLTSASQGVREKFITYSEHPQIVQRLNEGINSCGVGYKGLTPRQIRHSYHG